MDKRSQDPLDRLLVDAYPAVEVSADFRLRLWRKLMKRPVADFRRVPASAMVLALVVGIAGGILDWKREGLENEEIRRVLNRSERWDLFGNAPHESLAGSVLRRMEGGNG